MQNLKLDLNQVVGHDSAMKNLSELIFSASYAQLGDDFSAAVRADALTQSRLVDVSDDCAQLMGLSLPDCSWLQAVCAGEQLLAGMKPVAALYAGHQFGHYVPQLGDGRALLLGDMTHDGRRWHWQLKGAGVTPFSRRGDGRAVLRSSIREYLVSEAMAGLGIPTTRALALVASDLPVYRESVESAACVLRVAQSFVRFGSFEVFYYRGQYDLLRDLADYVIEHDFPAFAQHDNPYLSLLEAVIERTARLLAHWQSVGFMHGVMNTDNMSIVGLTLDYGPFMFMERYQPDFICNHSDTEGRYAFNRQPEVALWNCACLAQALLPLLDEDTDTAVKLARVALDGYWLHYQGHYLALMRAKLGLTQVHEGDALLIRDWLNLLQREQLDFTLAHRRLATQTRCPYIQAESVVWWGRYQTRLAEEAVALNVRVAAMNAVNPLYVLRTWMAQEAIDKANRGDDTGVQRLRALLANPFVEQAGMEVYASESPDWACGLSLSCSS
jgi:hypothetical protein